MTSYIVGGTQAGTEGADEILVMKLTQIRKTVAPALDEVSARDKCMIDPSFAQGRNQREDVCVCV